MVKVLLNGNIIAESNETVVVEGNHYFPKESINQEFLKGSNLKTTCPWKGVANYYNLDVDGKSLENFVWYYPHPSAAAKEIKDKIAFYQKNGIKVVED
ncbi:MAG: DUF427 domain-containing protein [Bacteroidales bacterium]|nr:DUF427 domain-containing protein [Bacteroidales bacterium]